MHFGVVTLRDYIQLRLLTIPKSSLPNTIMIIKIYPDLRWEIVDLEWIDPSKNNWDRKAPYSEYDIIREFDDLNYTDRVSNVIFLIKKSSSIKKGI